MNISEQRGVGAPGPALPQPAHCVAGIWVGELARHAGPAQALPTPVPSGGRSINVTGQGFSLVQRFAMVVIAEPLRSWRRRREAGPLQPVTVSPGVGSAPAWSPWEVRGGDGA